MNEKLTVKEGLRLQDLEKEITKHKDGFVKCGLALEEIRDTKLYRKDFTTFEEYCQKKWGFGRRHINNLIQGAVAVKALPKDLGKIIPNPHAASVLTKVNPEHRVEVLKLAQSKGPVTAKSINENKNTVLAGAAAKASPDKAPVIRDKIGYPVPDKALKFWERRQEVQDWMAMISEVKCGIERAFKDKDLLYVHIRQSIIGDLNMVREGLSYALPYAVCTSCQGRLADKCMLCKGTGVLSQQLYMKVPADVRKMHENKVKGGAK